MTDQSPAAELRAAADRLLTARFAGAMTATPAVAALLAARAPLAKLLEDCAELHEPHTPGLLLGIVPPGCQWCADEDFPCADMRNALAVAHAINGGKKRSEMQIDVRAAPDDDAYARGFAAGRRTR